jgi:epoxide hydrolase-like predicted phosphatase
MGNGLAAGRYRGLLVDWGGVMTSNVFDTFRAFCESEGLAPDTIREKFSRDPVTRELLIALEVGELSEDAFEPRFAEILGVSAPGLIDRMFSAGQTDEEMLAVVRQVRRAGIATGLISNSWGTRRYDRVLLAELFDGVVISGEVRMRKPTPDIYLLGARRIALDPRQCVFVDDLPFNLEPAAELGMQIVHHRSYQGTVVELERLFGLHLR